MHVSIYFWNDYNKKIYMNVQTADNDKTGDAVMLWEAFFVFCQNVLDLIVMSP